MLTNSLERIRQKEIEDEEANIEVMIGQSL